MCFIACSIASICNNNFSGINRELLISYLLSLQNYDGGFCSERGLESHVGNTFCAVGALALLDALSLLKSREKLVEFMMNRLNRGFIYLFVV
jgi:geranylgeranyl transferase type-2 subunit beta